jgi:hypothetical protein
MKSVRACAFFIATVLVATTASHAATPDITLTMDDLPTQPVHGLIHPSGVQFGFTVGRTPSLDANYASGGPGPITFVQDPSIEGPSNGVLSITFPSPTPVVRFGVARSIGNSTSAIVELLDESSVSMGITTLTLDPMPLFAEGQFDYSGPPVKRAIVRFDAPETRFALDNLVFRIVPEPPSCIFLFCAGLFWLASPRSGFVAPSARVVRGLPHARIGPSA